MSYSVARAYRMGVLKRGEDKQYEEFKRVARLVWPAFGERQVIIIASLARYRAGWFAGMDRNLVLAFGLNIRRSENKSEEQRDLEKQAALRDFCSRTSVRTLDRWADCLVHFELLS